ncbi:FlaG family protein [Hydrogenimonas thermophila]|uniref:FlaG family protein n=1 Tax=Hydrogenimonas thermophila TaxID=223786 RepID=UPI002936DCEA|nr:FlaG family protein [Hydrogenimonas thermophila]WOE68923.1 FlaG family protein [Hydrogenimonas thermophila]WOE71430.1 FlaG family protein [Hydrogenimonas thermophila]
MEIYNTVANAHQSIQTKQDSAQRIQTAESQLNETNPSKQQKVDENENEDKKYNEKEIKKKLQEITEQLNKEMDTLNTTIRFGFNDKVEEMYVSVIDTKDNRVIRQIPSEEAMQLAAKMRELVGMLFDEKG